MKLKIHSLRKWQRQQKLVKKHFLETELKNEIKEEDPVQIIRNQKRYEWLAKGYDPELVEMALRMADNWINSIAYTFIPPEMPELRKKMIEINYAKALEVAERWLIKMTE